MTSASNFPTWIIGVRFVVSQDRRATRSGEVDVSKGCGGKIIGFSSRGVAYPNVQLEDGKTGTTARRVLQIGSGWPYEARQSWVSSRNNSNELNLGRTDRGKVIGYSDNLLWANVTVVNRCSSDNEKAFGWVPSQVIKVGTHRKFGDIAIVNKNGIEALRTDVQPSRPSGEWRHSKVAFVVKALLTDIATNGDVLTEADREIRRDLRTESDRDAATHAIVEGLNSAGLLTLLENKSNCTIDDVARACRPTGSVSTRGIYLRFYAKFRSVVKWQGTSRIYTGSAINFKAREKSYVSQFDPQKPGSRGQHGMSYRDAGVKYAVAICDLSSHVEHSLLLAETVLMLLFGTYDNVRLRGTQEIARAVSASSDAQTSAQQAVSHLSTGVSERECEEIEHDVEEEDVEFSSLTKDDKRASWQQMKVQAEQIIHLASATFRKVGWVPLRERPTFAASHGRMQGLNIQTPICASWSRPLFVQTFGPNRIFYHRTALSCIPRGDGMCLGHFGSTNSGHVNFTVHPSSAPPLGTKIHLCFEVTADGSPHPESWARLPEVCRYEDAVRARTLAVKAMFYDGNSKTWKSKYLQTAHMPARFNDSVPGGIKSMGQALGILNSLEGKSFTNAYARAFDFVIAPSRVIQISFDPLRQVKTIQEMKQALAYVKPGNRLHDDAVKHQLEAAGARSVGGTFGQFPDAVKGAANKRATCDRCMLAHTNHEKRKAFPVSFAAETSRRAGSGTCSQVPGTDQCQMCAFYDLPCSWTRDITKKPKLIRALWFPGEDKSKALTIEDPVWARNEQELSTSA